MARRQRRPGAVSVEAAVILFLFLVASATSTSSSASPSSSTAASPPQPLRRSLSAAASAASPSSHPAAAADVTEVAPVPALAAVPIALPEYLRSGSNNASAPAPTHGVRDTCSGMFAAGLRAGPLSSVIKAGSLWVYPHDDDGDGNPAPPIVAKRSASIEECAAECENEGSAAALSSGVLACQFSFCPPDSRGSSFKTTTSGSGNNGSSTNNNKPALLLPGCPDGFGGPLIPPGQCRFSFESISLHRLHVLKVPTPPPGASPTTVISGEHVRLATRAYLDATVKGYRSLGPVMYFTPNVDRLAGPPPSTDGGGNKTPAEVTCSLEGVRQFERSVGDPRCLRNLTGAEGPADAAKMCDSLPGCNAFSFVPVGGIRVAWRLYNRFQDMPPYRVSSSPTALFWYGDRPSACVMPFPGILYRRGGGGKNYDARFTSAAAAVAASLASSGEGGGGSGGPGGGGRVFGIVAGVAVCFSLVATLAFLAIRRRRRRNGGGGGGHGGGGGGGGKAGRRSSSSWSPFSTPSMQGEIAATNAASEASAAAVAAASAGAMAGSGGTAAAAAAAAGSGAAAGSKWSLFKNSGGAGSSSTTSAHRAGDVELGNPRGVRSSSDSSSLSSSSVAAVAAAAAAAPSRAIASRLSCVASLPPDAAKDNDAAGDDRRREWEIPLESVRLLQRPDGSDWLLGEGAYGKVFRGVVDGIQEVAVKIFFPASSSSSASSAASSARALLSSSTAAASARSVDEDVRAEVALLRSLRHPNVINFLGASFLEDGTAVLITELCVRGDLAEAAAADERAAMAKKVARAGGGGGGSGGGSNKRFTWQPEYLRDGGGVGGGGGAAGAKKATGDGDDGSGPGGGGSGPDRGSGHGAAAAAAAAAAATGATSSGAARRRPGTGLNWQIAAGVAKGLAYLHNQRNVVHLDIKPQNILLDSAYVPKIADVGVAKVIKRAAGAGFGFGGRGSSGGSGSGSASSFGQQHLSTLKHTVGTYAYCAPEVFTGRGVGVKADVFSLGVLLWQLCTGEVPRKRQMRTLEVPGEAPTAAVREMIDACLSEKAEERPSAAEIAAFFEGGLAQLDAEAGVVAAAGAAPSVVTSSRPGSLNLASKFDDAGAPQTM